MKSAFLIFDTPDDYTSINLALLKESEASDDNKIPFTMWDIDAMPIPDPFNGLCLSVDVVSSGDTYIVLEGADANTPLAFLGEIGSRTKDSASIKMLNKIDHETKTIDISFV